MIPPVWIQVQWGWAFIPVPVVLLWPVLVLVWFAFGLALTVYAAVAAATGAGRPQEVGKVWFMSWRLLCALKGVRIQVEQPRARLSVSIV